MTVKRAAIAAAMVLLAGPAFAADAGIPASGSPLYSPTPMVTAHVEMGAAAIFGNNGLLGNAGGGIIASGRANKVLWHGWNLELEGSGASLIASSTSSVAISDAYGHLWIHPNPAWSLGGFGGASFVGGATVGMVGVESKTELGPLNVGAMVADSFQPGHSFVTGAVSANDYVTANSRFGLKAALGDGLYVLTADAEKRFFDPISIWGSVNYAAATGGGTAHAWAGLIGLRVFADGNNGTLKGQDDIVPWHISNPLRAY